MTTTADTAADLARPDPDGTDDATVDDVHDPETDAADTAGGAGTDEAPRRTSRFTLWLGVVALTGLAIRLIYLFGWKNPGLNAGDAEYYHEGAKMLADGDGYIHPFQLIRHGLTLPGADHPPGYLTVLAAFSLLGLRTFLEHQIISCVLGTIGVVAIGFAGRRIAGERVGLLAAVIVAISPNVWFHDSLVMSESLVVATTALVLLTAYRWWDRPTLASAALFGLAVGGASLVRSEALLLAPFIAVPLLLWHRRSTARPVAAAAAGTAAADDGRDGLSGRAVGAQLGAAAGVAVLVIAPWVGYNVSRFEHPVTLSAQFDHTLVSANCDEVFYGPSTGYWSRNCVEAAEPLTDPLDDASEEGIVFRKLARDYVSEHKGRTVAVLGARVARTFGLYQPENQIDLDDLYDGKEKGLGQAGLITWYAVALAGIAGMVGLRRAGRPVFPVLAVVGATVLTVMVTYGATRFRFPAELALCIPAAVSLDAALGSVRRPSFLDRFRRATGDEAEVGTPVSTNGDSNGHAGDEPDTEIEPEPTLEETEHEGTPEAASTDVPSGLGSSSGRFAGFDGLRAIAALGVLLTHVALASGLVARSSTSPYLARADVGVALFFVLSGFLLYRPFVAARLDGRERPNTRRYLRHRFLRIFPAYWLALTVLAVVLDIRHLDQMRTPWDFLLYYGLLQSYSKASAVGGLQQAWTLTNEMAFYLILPLWAAGGAWLWRKLRGRQALVAELGVLAAAMGAALAFRFWLHSFEVNDPTTGNVDPRFHWILANFNMFVPGMALALVLEWSRRRDEPLKVLELVRRHPMVCWGAAVLCFWAVSTRLSLTILGTLGQKDAMAKELLYVGIGMLLMTPVALSGDALPRSLRWLGSRVMVFLGTLSYGIYLWHEGIIDIYRDTRNIQTDEGVYRLAGSFPEMLVVVTLATVVVAAVSYYLVERPALALKDRDHKLFAGWAPVALPTDARVVTPEDRAAAEAAHPHRPGRVQAAVGRTWDRVPAWVLPVGVVGLVVALPTWGLWKSPGPPMEEGFMLVFPERVLAGDIPNKDFLHLYGPGSLWTIAAFFKVFGIDLWVERLVGLLQLLGLIGGVTVLGYRWGRWVAAVAGSTTAILILPPIGFTALAWVGGIAFALWAVIMAVKVFDPDEELGDEADEAARTRRRRYLVTAGVLAGCALLFRPDLVMALGLPLGFMFVWGLDRTGRKHLVLGVLAGVSPYLVHFLLAGPGNAITGMVIEPVFVLRPGRTLPFPPPTDRMTSFLGGALLFRNWPWPFPALDQPFQVFIWVPILVVVTFGIVYVGHRARRAGSPEGWRLLCLGLLAVGILPQAIQRADVAHLDWVSALPFGLLPLAIAEWGRLKGTQWRVTRSAALVPLAIMFVAIPHYTVRWYADYTGQTFGYRTEGVTAIHNRGRTFIYGREDVAEAAEAMIADIERETEPGDKLIVGTGDLRKTPYSESFFYFLLPQLEPGTAYIEMDPGMANAEDSGLADELREADVVILSTLYDNWTEENTSRDFGSDEPNEVLAEDYCLYEKYGTQTDPTSPSYERGLYELYLRDGRC